MLIDANGMNGKQTHSNDTLRKQRNFVFCVLERNDGLLARKQTMERGNFILTKIVKYSYLHTSISLTLNYNTCG